VRQPVAYQRVLDLAAARLKLCFGMFWVARLMMASLVRRRHGHVELVERLPEMLIVTSIVALAQPLPERPFRFEPLRKLVEGRGRKTTAVVAKVQRAQRLRGRRRRNRFTGACFLTHRSDA
jgi:hypothetical protein